MFCVVNLFVGHCSTLKKDTVHRGSLFFSTPNPNTIKYTGDFCPLYAIVTSSIHGPVNAL